MTNTTTDTSTTEGEATRGKSMGRRLKIWYSFDGRVWYWMGADREQIRSYKQAGIHVMRDNWWSRLSLR